MSIDFVQGIWVSDGHMIWRNADNGTWSDINQKKPRWGREGGSGVMLAFVFVGLLMQDPKSDTDGRAYHTCGGFHV